MHSIVCSLGLFEKMHRSIWNDEFWLPKNVTWKDFHQLEENGVAMPKITDLLYVYPLAALIYVTRLIFEYIIAQPLGRWLRIREQNNSSSSTRVSPLAKFSESTWRFTFYLAIFIYGLVVLQNVRDH